AAQFLYGWRADREAVRAFCREAGDRAEVVAYEVRLPADLLVPGPPPELDEVFASPDRPAASWFEVSAGPDWLRSLEVLIGALGRHPGGPGCKYRCGGPEATSFPSPEDVALVIAGS